VRELLPVAVAGGTFAAAAVVGLLLGVLAAGRTGQPLLVPAGLVLGFAIGGYSAVRLIVRSMR
jgi:hypothetical protein